MPARAAQRALLEEGVIVSIESHGVDVGTDITVGLSRKPVKLKQRSDAAARSAIRVDEVAKLDRRASRLGGRGSTLLRTMAPVRSVPMRKRLRGNRRTCL